MIGHFYGWIIRVFDRTWFSRVDSQFLFFCFLSIESQLETFDLDLVRKWFSKSAFESFRNPVRFLLSFQKPLEKFDSWLGNQGKPFEWIVFFWALSSWKERSFQNLPFVSRNNPLEKWEIPSQNWKKRIRFVFQSLDLKSWHKSRILPKSESLSTLSFLLSQSRRTCFQNQPSFKFNNFHLFFIISLKDFKKAVKPRKDSLDSFHFIRIPNNFPVFTFPTICHFLQSKSVKENDRCLSSFEEFLKNSLSLFCFFVKKRTRKITIS